MLHVLIRQVEYEPKDAVLEQCKTLILRTPPINGEKKLRLMQRNLEFLLSSSTNRTMSGHPLSSANVAEVKSLIGTLWERSILHYPFDKSLAEFYFDMCFNEKRWAGCHKVS